MKKYGLLVLLSLASPGMVSAEIVKCIDHGEITYRNNSCSNKSIASIPNPISQSVPSKAPTLPKPPVNEPVTPELLSLPPVEESHSPDQGEAASVGTSTSFAVPLQNGSYFVDGTVGGIPTRFQIDTGASNTAVSKKIADQAGFFESYCPKRLEAATANGVVSVCLVTVPELTFGGFSVQNVDVIVMPNMQQEALLGMDVLQHYVIEQRAKALKISN